MYFGLPLSFCVMVKTEEEEDVTQFDCRLSIAVHRVSFGYDKPRCSVLVVRVLSLFLLYIIIMMARIA